jgi:hypothetical protein
LIGYILHTNSTVLPFPARSDFMTTIQIQLPDDLAQDARAAGLLSTESIERLLRDRLRQQAGDALRTMWNRMPGEELTPDIEEMINQEVQAARTEQRQRTSN